MHFLANTISQLTHFLVVVFEFIVSIITIVLIGRWAAKKMRRKDRRFDTDVLAIVGKRGGGKSTWLSEYGINKTKEGLTIWANSWYDWSKYLKPKNLEKIYYAEEVIDLLDMRKGCFLIDEGHLKLASRRWWKISEDIETALSLSRHIEMDVILAAQDFEFIDKYCRRIVDNVIFCHKVGMLGWWTAWRPKHLDAEGNRKKGRWPNDFGLMLHTKNIHATYDDRALYGALLANRPKRTWHKNGTSIEPPSDYIPPSLTDYNAREKETSARSGRQKEESRDD